MTEVVNTTEQQLGAALELKQCEALGGRELKDVVKTIRDLRELKTLGSTEDLNKREQKLFGKRDVLWDSGSQTAGDLEAILNTSKELNLVQKKAVYEGINTLTGYFQQNDLTRVGSQLREIRRGLERATGSNKRAFELLSAAAELVVAKWCFGRDRELVGRLEVLGRDENIQTIELNLEEVRKATKETRKRDEVGDRADVKGKKRITREIWYTEVLEQGFSGKGNFDKESASTEFIREEIKGDGGVEEKAAGIDRRNKFGNGMEEMVNWRFFRRENLNAAIANNHGPNYIMGSLEIIRRVAVWADHEWKAADGLPQAEKLRQWTVGCAMTREVWRVIQDNVRAGLTLLENDVTGDMLSCRSKDVFTQDIVRNKANGIFEFAIYPQQTEKQKQALQKLRDQVEPSFDVIKSNTKRLKKKGESVDREEVFRAQSGGEYEFEIPTQSEEFNQMFLIDKKGEVDITQLEYQVWQARVRLHKLTNYAFDIPDPLRETDEKGPSLWAYIEGAAVFPNKDLEPEALKSTHSAFIPTHTEFWLMQFYLNQGKDVVVKDINSLPEYKRTLVNRFKEVVVKAYYAPAILKRGEIGVWPDHSRPVSPEIYNRRIRNLEQGLMIWPESERPMLVELPYYIQWNSWKAVSHTTEFGPEEYEKFLRSNQKDPDNPEDFIGVFPAFFNQKIMAGLGLHLSTDLIWQTMAMVNEFYPLVWSEKRQRHEIITNPEELYKMPEGQLWAIYFKETHEAFQNYIYDNLGISEGLIYNYIRFFLIGKDVPTRDARHFIAPYAMNLWHNFIFSKHTQEAWCGNSDHPNEYYGRRIIDLDTLEIGTQSTILRDHFEPAPIERDLGATFTPSGEKLNSKETAALILTAVPDAVIDKHLVTALLGRKTSDVLNGFLKEVKRLEKQIWPGEKVKPYSALLSQIALGAKSEEIGNSLGRALNDVGRVRAVTELVEIINLALRYQAENIYQPDLFYELFLFRFAREKVGYYKNNRWLRINHAYLADVDVWEEIAQWSFKAGPRKGQPIYYHPMFSPGGTTLADRYFTGAVPVSSLTKYGKDNKGGWEGGDFILSLVADTIFKTNAEEQQDRILLYQELNRFAPRITIDMGSDKFKHSQLHGSLADVDFFRPGVEYALTIKYDQFGRLIDKLRLNAFQKRAIRKVLFGAPGVWAEVKKNASYQFLDHAFGRPDWWEKVIEWFKKTSGTVTGGTSVGGLIGSILDSPFAPIPQFRALLPAVITAVVVAPIVVSAGWIPASIFGVSWLGYYIAGVYTSNLVGLISQWVFSQIYQGKINLDKDEGVNFRYLPNKEDKEKGINMASQRISDQMLLNLVLCQAPTLFSFKKLPENHPLTLIRQTQEIFEAIAKDQLATS